MTLSELNKHRALVEELNTSEELLQGLWEMVAPGAYKMDGMPRTSGVSDPTARLAVEISVMDDRIAALKKEIAESEVPVSNFINGISNAQAKVIFRLRFLQGMCWKEVSQVSKYLTPELAKETVYRQLRQINKKPNHAVSWGKVTDRWKRWLLPRQTAGNYSYITR